MKLPLSLLSFVSSFAALLALPLSPELAVSPIVLTGLVLLLRADYGSRRPSLVRAKRAVNVPERLRLAA